MSRNAVSIDVTLALRGRDILAGRAFLSSNRGRVTTVFRYDSSYLASKGAFPLDPALPLFEGSHAIQDGLPFAFADSAPDRWGRNLIRKRLQSVGPDGARREVTDIDYLLEVSDATRQGALRFTVASENSDEKFLAGHADVPKLIELPRLLAACDRVVGDGDLAAIKELLDAGTGSLGGARPKASVRDGGRLLIAKFSSLRDEWDVIAWEKTALDLAERAGITVPGRRLERIAGRSVLLLDRFDRTPDGARIPYLSAMSLLTARDGNTAAFNYLDLAEAVAEYGAETVRADLVELWRRAIFSVAIHNTDDHLRNHGFLRADGGWAPSPVFDINPNPDIGVRRELAIGVGIDPADEILALREVAPSFGVDRLVAEEILNEVFNATRLWRECAGINGLPARELRLMEDAFAPRFSLR